MYLFLNSSSWAILRPTKGVRRKAHTREDADDMVVLMLGRVSDDVDTIRTPPRNKASTTHNILTQSQLDIKRIIPMPLVEPCLLRRNHLIRRIRIIRLHLFICLFESLFNFFLGHFVGGGGIGRDGGCGCFRCGECSARYDGCGCGGE